MYTHVIPLFEHKVPYLFEFCSDLTVLPERVNVLSCMSSRALRLLSAIPAEWESFAISAVGPVVWLPCSEADEAANQHSCGLYLCLFLDRSGVNILYDVVVCCILTAMKDIEMIISIMPSW